MFHLSYDNARSISSFYSADMSTLALSKSDHTGISQPFFSKKAPRVI